MRLFVLIGLLSAFSTFHASSAEELAVIPANVKRVLFLGDSITYDGKYVTAVEAYFVTRHPERSVQFINVGLPSETVSGLSEQGHAGGQFPRPDLHERLARVLELTKPDLVFACYGMNCGIYQPLDPERFQKFKDGITWLHDEVTKAGAKIVHVTPPVYDPIKGEAYATVLSTYSEWMLSQKASGWDVADLHAPMRRYLEEHRKLDPKYAFGGDGVHPNEQGHWVMAKQILLHLGAKDIQNTDSTKDMIAAHPKGAELFKLIAQRQNITKDAYLTTAVHKRPGMNKGLPLPEAQAKAEEIEKQIRALLVK